MPWFDSTISVPFEPPYSAAPFFQRVSCRNSDAGCTYQKIAPRCSSLREETPWANLAIHVAKFQKISMKELHELPGAPQVKGRCGICSIASPGIFVFQSWKLAEAFGWLCWHGTENRLLRGSSFRLRIEFLRCFQAELRRKSWLSRSSAPHDKQIVLGTHSGSYPSVTGRTSRVLTSSPDEKCRHDDSQRKKTSIWGNSNAHPGVDLCRCFNGLSVKNLIFECIDSQFVAKYFGSTPNHVLRLRHSGWPWGVRISTEWRQLQEWTTKGGMQCSSQLMSFISAFVDPSLRPRFNLGIAAASRSNGKHNPQHFVLLGPWWGPGWCQWIRAKGAQILEIAMLMRQNALPENPRHDRIPREAIDARSPGSAKMGSSMFWSPFFFSNLPCFAWLVVCISLWNRYVHE